jgi:transcriptional regulator with XRE-family HTH domain
MNGITIEQIKAARGLLGWTQGQLAKATGISLTALNNIERKSTSPRQSTLNLIGQALERGGVEFTDGPGVKMRGEPFEYYEFKGKHFIDQSTADIMSTLQGGGSIYICSWDESKITQHASDADKAYQRFVRDHNIDERIITPEGDTNFISRPKVYRWLPRTSLGPLNWQVYGDKISFYLWEKPYRAITIRNATMAEAYKNQFLYLWKQAKVPSIGLKKKN